MFSKRIRQDRQDDNTQDDDAGNDYARDDTAPTASPFDVLINHDGSAAVDGEPLRVPEGEPVHVVVLDMMHRHAEDLGVPVEAVIFDRPGGEVTLVEVAPDGSSRVLLHEKHDETPAAEPRSVAPPPTSAPATGVVPPQVMDSPPVAVRSQVMDPPPVAVPPPVTAPPPVAVRPTGPPPVEAGRPSVHAPSRSGGTHPAMVDEPVPDAVPQAVPDELAELVALVRHSVDAGALEQAAALAFRLREHTARAFGREHPYTLEAHALEAFVAHRSDNHRLAAATCIELARIRHRQGDPRVREELTRAAAAWLLVEDVPSAVEHGRALLAVLLAVSSTRGEQGGRTVVDAALPRLVNRRMRALTDASDTRVTGAA
ncbi:hypothetical protein [Streptomyces sp. NPDC093544]|uniref:hypothetical protein n=1 Tax=Streptomyces sp. NPDC093544 TaxID=3155200 RepID=UPI003443D525